MLQRHLHSTRSKVLLLDVDGVILQQKKVLHHVSNNILHYYAKELKLPLNKALHLNKLLYTEYGHSYRGLCKVFNFDKSIHHFNTAVYTPDVIQSVEDTDKDTIQHIHYMQLRQMVMRCKHEGVPVYLFTNAPLIWCKAVLATSGLDKFIPDENIISCDHDTMILHKDDGFKPVDVVYNTVEHFVKSVHYLDDPLYIFVEDSFKNLTPIIGRSSWYPVYLEPKMKFITEEKVSVVRNAKECKMLIDKILHK